MTIFTLVLFRLFQLSKHPHNESATSGVFGILVFILAFSAEIRIFVTSAKSNKGRLVWQVFFYEEV